MYARNSLKLNILKENYQKAFDFFLCTQSLFIDNMKNKRGLELVTSLSLRCETCLEKSPF